MARTLRCNCTEFGRAGCPVHVMWDHLAYLRMQFTSRWSEDGPAWDLPLFPRFDGGVVCKAAMAKTIAHAATLLHVPLSAPDGSERVSGHSLRVSGAQGLARSGWDFWAIQLQGRWHSDVVKHYVREAHLTPVGGAAHSGSGPTLEQVADAVIQKLGCIAQVGSGDLPKSGGSAQPHPEWTAPLLVAEQPARSAEPGLSAEKLVLHTGSGIYHRLPEQGSSRAACGWGFASSGTAVMVPDCTAGPHAWFQLCSRCWPQARELAKASPQPMALASAFPSSDASRARWKICPWPCVTEGSSGLLRGRARFAHPAEDLLDSSCRGQGIRGGGPPRWQLPWALHLGGSWGSRLWWRLEGGLSAGWVRSLGWLLANLATVLFPSRRASRLGSSAS